MTPLFQTLREAQAALQQAGIAFTEARLEVQLLLQHTLNVDRAWLIAHSHDAVPEQAVPRFNTLVERRRNGEPIAYILGQREFFGLTLAVTPATLIPRPDTETLVEAALQHIPPDAVCNVLDLGTGSGAIALAIASERPQAALTATDRAEQALAVATANAGRLGIRHVRFAAGSWFDAVAGQRFDVIVSNPPYIADGDPHLQQGDLRFEPMTALASGVDGLADLRQIIRQAPMHLTGGGWLLLEHGYDQAASVRQLLAEHGFLSVASRRDLGGNDRISYGQWPRD